MDEKIVNPAEETVIPAEPVCEIPESPVETLKSTYKPNKLSLVFGIIALVCSVVGAICVLYTYAESLITLVSSFIPYLNLIISFFLWPISCVRPFVMWPAIILAVVFGIIGIVVAIVQMKRASKHGVRAGGAVTTGLILSIGAIAVVVIALLAAFGKVLIQLILGALAAISSLVLAFIAVVFNASTSMSGY